MWSTKTRSPFCKMTYLGDLPVDHPLRKRPLLGAIYGPKGTKESSWKSVLESYKLAKVCYNDLGKAWTTWDDWRFLD